MGAAKRGDKMNDELMKLAQEVGARSFLGKIIDILTTEQLKEVSKIIDEEYQCK